LRIADLSWRNVSNKPCRTRAQRLDRWRDKREDSKEGDMRTEQQVRDLIAQLYHDLGEDPGKLKGIKPVGGDWSTAAGYDVVRSDDAVAHVSRKDVDEANEPGIADALSRFGS
jgi:hypothetical protein